MLYIYIYFPFSRYSKVFCSSCYLFHMAVFGIWCTWGRPKTYKAIKVTYARTIRGQPYSVALWAISHSMRCLHYHGKFYDVISWLLFVGNRNTCSETLNYISSSYYNLILNIRYLYWLQQFIVLTICRKTYITLVCVSDDLHKMWIH